MFSCIYNDNPQFYWCWKTMGFLIQGCTRNINLQINIFYVAPVNLYRYFVPELTSLETFPCLEQ